jgi:hypothetical protein
MYQDAAAQMQQANQTCSGYASVVSQLGQQASQMMNTSSSGYNCQNQAAAMPSSHGGMGDTGDSSASAAPTTASCAANPALAGCQVPAASASQASASTAAFQETQKSTNSAGNNVADTSRAAANMMNPYQAVAAGQNAPAGAAMVVANNSGGAIPNNTSGGARLDPARKGKPGGVTGSSSVADILGGVRSGGGYSQPAGRGGDDFYDPGSRRRGAGGPARGLASVPVGLDLKNYLPGGAMDPNRRLGGLANNREIAGRFEDMWKNISSRYNEKCRLGILADCR